MRVISSVLKTFEFTCNLYAMDTALKTEHPLTQAMQAFGMGKVLLLGLRWHLPITVTVQAPGSSDLLSACLRFHSQLL